jgi:hypothetical protein
MGDIETGWVKRAGLHEGAQPSPPTARTSVQRLWWVRRTVEI